MTDITEVLTSLRRARGELVLARLASLDAKLHLVCSPSPGPFANRAAQLCEKISDSITHTDRLIFYIEGAN